MAGALRAVRPRGEAYRILPESILADPSWNERYRSLEEALERHFKDEPSQAVCWTLMAIRSYDAERLRHLDGEKARGATRKKRLWSYLSSQDELRCLQSLGVALKHYLRGGQSEPLSEKLATLPDQIAEELCILIQIEIDITRDLPTFAPELLRRTRAAITQHHEKHKNGKRGGKPSEWEILQLAKDLAHVSHSCGWLFGKGDLLDIPLNRRYLKLTQVVFQDYLRLNPNSRQFRSTIAREGFRLFIELVELIGEVPRLWLNPGQQD